MVLTRSMVKKQHQEWLQKKQQQPVQKTTIEKPKPVEMDKPEQPYTSFQEMKEDLNMVELDNNADMKVIRILYIFTRLIIHTPSFEAFKNLKFLETVVMKLDEFLSKRSFNFRVYVIPLLHIVRNSCNLHISLILDTDVHEHEIVQHFSMTELLYYQLCKQWNGYTDLFTLLARNDLTIQQQFVECAMGMINMIKKIQRKSTNIIIL